MNTTENRLSLDMILARHCAPVLLGKKPAALFPTPHGWDETPANMPPPGDMRFLSLRRPEKNALIFAYRPRLLSHALVTAEARETLAALGYPAEAADNPGPRLAFLERRFWESVDFPHEVGFFLATGETTANYAVCGRFTATRRGRPLCSPNTQSAENAC